MPSWWVVGRSGTAGGGLELEVWFGFWFGSWDESKVYFEPGSGCGGWGKGTSRMVPMGVERVVLRLRVMMLPEESVTSGSVRVFIDA